MWIIYCNNKSGNEKSKKTYKNRKIAVLNKPEKQIIKISLVNKLK